MHSRLTTKPVNGNNTRPGTVEVGSRIIRTSMLHTDTSSGMNSRYVFFPFYLYSPSHLVRWSENQIPQPHAILALIPHYVQSTVKLYNSQSMELPLQSNYPKCTFICTQGNSDLSPEFFFVKTAGRCSVFSIISLTLFPVPVPGTVCLLTLGNLRIRFRFTDISSL